MRSKSKMNRQSDRFYSDSRKKSILAKHITTGLPSPLIVTWLFMEALKGAFLYIFVLTFYVQLVHLHSIKHITSKHNKALVKLFGQDT